MSELKLCGIVLCALIICIIFKNIKNEYSLFVRLVLTIGVSCISIALIYPVLSFIDKISANTSFYGYLPTLIKALGITFAVQITADVCKDAGESSLAERVSLFGKAEILLLSLPLIKNLFELCESLLV